MLDVYDNIEFDKERLYDIECPKLNDAVIRTIGDISYDEITYFDNVTVYPAKYFDPISTGKLRICYVMRHILSTIMPLPGCRDLQGLKEV